ncbi:MAG: GerMN domain-containing protein [Acidimicrobiales bacterium]
MSPGCGAARRTWWVGLVLVSAALSGGCGVPAQTHAQIVAEDDVPFGLASSNSSTTSTTAVMGFDPLLDTGVVALYFSDGTRIVAVTREVAGPSMLLNVVHALAVKPGTPVVVGSPEYRSAVGPDDVVEVTVQAGIATVELADSFRDLPTTEQRLAVAQLVLTLTDQPGIGQVAFVVGDQPVPVPRADGTLAREKVSRDDFMELLEGRGS